MKLQTLAGALALLGISVLAGCSSSQTSTTRPKVPSATPETLVERALQPLADSGFKAQITVANPPVKLAHGQRQELTVRVKNTSSATWPLHGRAGDGIYQVNLGDHWVNTDGNVKVDERIALPHAVKPGEEVEMSLTIVAPDKAGDFTVEIDMVQEGVAWFTQKGSQPARLKIKVE